MSGRSGWLSRDPIGEEGGVNLYGIVINSLVNLIDAFGLSTGYGNPVSGPIGSVGPSQPGWPRRSGLRTSAAALHRQKRGSLPPARQSRSRSVAIEPLRPGQSTKNKG